MSLILIKAFFARFFSNRYVWYAIGAGAVVFGLIHWHNKSVDAAIERTTVQMNADFAAAQKQALLDEQARSNKIINNLKGEYESQIKSAQSTAQSLIDSHRTGAVRLSVPAHCPSPIITGDSGSTQSNPVSMAAESRAELSEESVRFFVGQAERADKQAVQLNALIDVVERLRVGATQ